MKKSILLGALSLLFVFASCSKLERNEKKYIDAMMGENVEEANAAYDEFKQWLMADNETMTYDFPYMREKLTDVHIVESEDHILRCYSWETERSDTTRSYANIAQWKLGDKMAAYSGSLEKLIANRKVDITIPFTLAHSIDTIIKIERTTPVVYLLVQTYTSGENMRYSYVTAISIKDMHPMFIPHYFDGLDNVGNGEYKDDGKVKCADLFKWDANSGKLLVSIPDDNGNIVPGKHDTYQLGDKGFKKVIVKE